MILYSQFSVVLPLYGPAHRHSIMKYVSSNVRDFFDSMLQQQWWRTVHVQKKLLTGLVAGEVSMAPGSVSGGWKGIHRCGRYPVSIDLSAEEGKKEPTF